MQGEECLLQAAAGGITLDPWDVCVYKQHNTLTSRAAGTGGWCCINPLGPSPCYGRCRAACGVLMSQVEALAAKASSCAQVLDAAAHHWTSRPAASPQCGAGGCGDSWVRQGTALYPGYLDRIMQALLPLPIHVPQPPACTPRHTCWLTRAGVRHKAGEGPLSLTAPQCPRC